MLTWDLSLVLPAVADSKQVGDASIERVYRVGKGRE
jgi:hypothetical protein